MKPTNNPQEKQPEQGTQVENVNHEDVLVNLLKEETKHKKYWLGFTITISVLLLGWIGLVLGFGRYEIGNKRLSLVSSSNTLKKELSSQAQDFRLTVTYPDQSTKTFNLGDMGYSLNADSSIKSIKRLHAADILMWWKPKKSEPIFDINQIKLHDFLQKSISVTSQPAKDASIKIQNGRIIIQNSIAGKRYGLVFPQDILNDSASSLKSSKIELQLLASKPAITTKQLRAHESELKKILSQRIVLNVNGTSKVLSSGEIGSLLDLSVDKNKQFKVDVNSGKVQAFIDKVARPYTQEAQDKVVVKRDDGSQVVLIEGREGTDVIGKQKIALDITSKLLKAEGIEVDLQISTAPFNQIVAGNYGKWIEVNTATKRLYAYANSKLVRSFDISAGAPATPTVLGEFKIQHKYIQQDMRGRNADGTDYFQPNVPWVSYFYQDYAIHGNYWRPLSYFGHINSSHGCVGMKVAESKWIYDWAPIGTPVIVHT